MTIVTIKRTVEIIRHESGGCLIVDGSLTDEEVENLNRQQVFFKNIKPNNYQDANREGQKGWLGK